MHSKSTSSSSPSDSAFSAFAVGDADRLGHRGNPRPRKNKINKIHALRYDTQRLLSSGIFAGDLPAHPARLCCRVAIPLKYAVKIHFDGKKHRYVHMFRCASRLVCPVCGAAIACQRAAEIMQAGKYLLKNGYSFFFATFTAQHTLITPVGNSIKKTNAAFRALKSGRVWQNLKSQYAIEHQIKVVETTVDKPDSKKKTGFHYHLHVLFFIKRNPLNEEEAKNLSYKLKKMWIHELKKVGLTASLERGCVIEIPKTRKGKITSSDMLKKLAKYVSKNIAFEMTHSQTKDGDDGEKDRRMSIWELQRLALTSHPELLRQYAEYMRAVKGVAWMTWSRGLKQLVGLQEKDDEEMLQGKEAIHIYTMSSQELRAVADQGGQRKLIMAADAGGLEAIKAGIAAALSGCDIATGEPWRPPGIDDPPEFLAGKFLQ